MEQFLNVSIANFPGKHRDKCQAKMTYFTLRSMHTRNKATQCE